MLGIIISLLTIVGIIATVLYSILKTPKNLRVFYGIKYLTIAGVAIIGVVMLILFG